ncbi:MAG: ATP-binding cassette domain-containing protein [Oscillospiraceae bacterium]|nr:ATP-binding cassette domain-containing protein [Oscillospiraceae bacterium]
MIEIKNLRKRYRDSENEILCGLNLKIEDGDFVFITGASGSGKSTLLKMILKEEDITSGDILVNGVSLAKMKRRDVPYFRRTIGIVFQDFRLIEKMTVFENVAFAMRIFGRSPHSFARNVNYVLGLVALEDKADRFPCELSGGEKQRVGLARALVNNPGIIIADEPTGNIDPSMSYEIVELLAEINKRGTTVIMVTHDMSVVSKFPLRVVKILQGIIKSDVQISREEIAGFNYF